MKTKQSGWVNRVRIMMSVLALGALSTLVALGTVGRFGGSIGTAHEWGMAPGHNLIAPRIDITFVGRFEGAPAAVNVPVHWEPEENLTGGFEPRLADFRIDDVVKGPQELSGQLISVRYAIVGYGTGGAPLKVPAAPLGVMPYTDIPTTVAGRRCLLLLKKIKDGPGDYQVAFNQEFMVAGERPQVSGWADLAPMRRLEYEFASAVGSPDPAVAYLATGSARASSSQAVGPVLVAALKKNLSSPDARLRKGTLVGLVEIGDLDTVYNLKGLLQEWRQNPATGIDPKLIGGFGPLSYVKNRNAVPALVELTMAPDASVRFGATYALRHIGGKDVVSALAARLDDEDSKVRYQAIQALAKHVSTHEVGVKSWVAYAPGVSIYQNDPDTPVSNWKRW